MKKRMLTALAVLAAVLLGAGCGAPLLNRHSSYWEDYRLTTYDDEPGYPQGYRWCEGVADMGEGGELTLYYLTLAEAREAEIVCSLARNQTRGEAALYWEDPEGELTLLHDLSGGGGSGIYALPEGTSRFLVRADAGKYDVGMGLSGLPEESILYLKGLPPLDDLPSLEDTPPEK